MNFPKTCVLVLMLWSLKSPAETCATRASELDQSERLRSIQSLFQSEGRVGLVNDTKGSFVVLTSYQDQLMIAFYTSGPFHMFPIKREGPVTFCDTDRGLQLIGLGKKIEVVVSDHVILAGGGPKRTFWRSQMPEDLRKLHHVDDNGIALGD